MLQEIDGVKFNDRQRDLELLARLVNKAGIPSFCDSGCSGGPL